MTQYTNQNASLLNKSASYGVNSANSASYGSEGLNYLSGTVNESIYEEYMTLDQFNTWIKDSKIQHIVYRGQDTEWDYEKSRNYVNFSDSKVTAQAFGRNIEEFYINLTNPFNAGDKNDIETLINALGGEGDDSDTMFQAQPEHFPDPNIQLDQNKVYHFHNFEEYCKRFSLDNSWEWVERDIQIQEMKRLGYDGLIMKEGGDVTYMTFSKDQIFPADHIIEDDLEESFSYSQGIYATYPKNIGAMTDLASGGLVEGQLNDKLDQRLWQNNKLIPIVRDKLLGIAALFRDNLDLYSVKDIRVTGSEANYNYNDNSDIDLHLVYDFSKIGVDETILTNYFNAKKKNFNTEYNFMIKQIPVEVGVEDINTPLVSTGVYSLIKDDWIIEPQNANKEVPDVDNKQLDYYIQKIEKAIESKDKDNIELLWKEIRQLRKDALKKNGEFSQGNLIFKELRNGKYIERLKNALNDAISKDLSLEYIRQTNYYPSDGEVVYNLKDFI